VYPCIGAYFFPPSACEYLPNANAVADYMNQHYRNYPKDRNLDTAKEFMDKNDDAYRKKVAGIAVQIIHDGDLEAGLSKKIF
jgi:hypothetical protein